MTATDRLTTDLKGQVLTLEEDLHRRVEADPEVKARWLSEHRQAIEAGRTAASWEAYLDDNVTQVAVAWVLATVFIRFCEDNALVSPVWITGPRHRRQEAVDAQLAYFRQHPERTDREWLRQAIGHLRGLPATTDLFDDRSPLWRVSPSGQAATALIDFWRRRDETGALVHDLADPDLSTRFLGDLYQDLSDHAKDTYALLQTPVFVEEFILDQTLEPALEERPLEGFTLIDPACGSGHFLLGAFDRFVTTWRRQEPGLSDDEVAGRALASVYGVDINPFAVAIARFRLTVAALRETGRASLEDAPDFHLNLAVGDSLLFGKADEALDLGADYDVDAGLTGFTYSAEDLDTLRRILRPGSYDVVVANPPYITVKDKQLNQRYRELYKTCKGTYALTVPFMERIFDLAKRGTVGQPAGWTGQITSNSFMKREFGTKLIEDFLADRDLRLVADTSGAYIPGHGTPTVIIVGRNQRPVDDTVRAVLGVRGEPGRPADAANGLVWRAIADHVGDPTYEDSWVTVTDLGRSRLASHPWRLSGGHARALSSKLESASSKTLVDYWRTAGYTGQTNADDIFLSSESALRRRAVPSYEYRPFLTGTEVRDFITAPQLVALFPYDENGELLPWPMSTPAARHMWPFRTSLGARATFSGGTYREMGRPWWAWHQVAKSRLSGPAITWAVVATHNHFAYLSSTLLHNRHAPVIQLAEGATEDDHLALLGVLNSSTACFWLKQNSYPKGGDPVGSDGARVSQQPWSDRYEFTGTTLQDFPLPRALPRERARTLDRLAQQSTGQTPAAVCENATPTAASLMLAQAAHAHLRGQMIAQQEELDWETYRLYGLIDEDLTYHGNDLPQLALGERAFEIVLARRVAAGEEETAWFDRHGSTPITELPDHWPAAYRELVQRRIDLITTDRSIGLLERPEYKRRWAAEPWVKQQERALRGWLLDRLEDRRYWFDAQGRPTPRSIAQLADVVARDEEIMGVLTLWDGRRDVALTDSLSRLLLDESVPYLAAYRLKESGMRKRAAWERTWELQRREDAGQDVGTIPVPPKYTSADFRKPAWWHARGKLDVPKERFILYPDANRPTDPTALLGWAGWDHAQQSLALATIIGAREADGWSDEQLVPLVAGLAELQPWVEQWHSEVDPRFGVSMAEFCGTELQQRALQVGKTTDELTAWRPAGPARGRKPRSRREVAS